MCRAARSKPSRQRRIAPARWPPNRWAGCSSRFALGKPEAFLKRAGAWLHYGEADLDHDLAVLRETHGQ